MTIENMANSRDGYPYAQSLGGDISGNGFADLIPVIPGKIGEREINIVSAKALHKALGVRRVFASWIKGRIDEYDFAEGVDDAVFDSLDFRNQSAESDHLTPERVFNPKRGRPEKDYLLAIGMGKELSMLENNEQGRAVRRYFIQCEEALQRNVPEIAAQYRRQLKARIGAANLFKPMCAALDVARAEQGKQTLPRHYTNESNMIARIVLGGLTAKLWAQMNSIAGEPRDGMNAEQLEHLAYLESTNITLIDMGMAYDQRKAELIRLSQRWLAKRLEARHE